MKLGIMQPYLFPYIGYFQLIQAVDKFVVYDDVNYIKQGWINRNRILNHGEPLTFTVPLSKAGSFAKINEVQINPNLYEGWKNKFLKTLELNYKKAPYFSESYDLIHKVLSEEDCPSISELAVESLLAVCKHLGIQKEFVVSSTLYNNQNLSGKDRVIDICRQEDATHYINPSGGQMLYNKEYFREKGLELSFIKSLPLKYSQFKNEFVPWLSIIDVLMFNPVEDVRVLLNEYELI